MDEDILKLLREIELKLASGSDVPSACSSKYSNQGMFAAAYLSRLMGVDGGGSPAICLPGDGVNNRDKQRVAWS